MWDKKKMKWPAVFIRAVWPRSAGQNKSINTTPSHTIQFRMCTLFSALLTIEHCKCRLSGNARDKYTQTIKRLFPFWCLTFLIFHSAIFSLWFGWFAVWHFIEWKSAAAFRKRKSELQHRMQDKWRTSVEMKEPGIKWIKLIVTKQWLKTVDTL